MNSYPNREVPTQDRLLDSIEQAIDEKARTGRADEARYGLVAQVANATPPVNEAFRLTLRARILAQGIQKGRREASGRDAAQPVKLRRLSLATLSVALAVALVFAFTRSQLVEWTGVLVARPGSGARVATEDLDALAEALNAAPAPRTVIVYPDLGSSIMERIRYKTVPLLLGEDVTPETTLDAVDAALPPDGYVDLVMAAAQEDDRSHQVRVTMEKALYRLYRSSGQASTEVYGVLERNTFLVGPVDAALESIGARFEGGVELVAGGVLDEPQAGMPLRVAFDWRVREPVSEPLVVFVHLQRGDYELVAQRDAVPGNGLFPVEEWRPGELVRDQFALLLPPDLPAGEYEMRVGIYDATTQRRYSLLEPEEGTYVVVRNWVLAGPVQGDQS